MNFALILFLLTLVTGILWAVDRLHFRRKRATDAPEPAWVEYAASFFPVLLVVFLLRSFVAEPFKIPSSSMRPTLEVGDFILVNKFAYGLRLPIVEAKFVPLGEPQRGDVVVFRYPVNPSQDFIKRVVGVGGDVVTYQDKKLTVNGQPLPQTRDGTYSYLENLRFETLERFKETARNGIGTHEYTIGINPQAAPVYPQNVRPFPGRENCEYNDRGFTCKVPQGQYFMMGDNRDQSSDSRYWGFVPDDHIKGRAFLVWMNFGDLKRIGNGIE